MMQMSFLYLEKTSINKVLEIQVGKPLSNLYFFEKI